MSSAMDPPVSAHHSGLRVPPYSLEAEQSVLGGLLIDNDAWDRVGDIVAAGDFYRREHREIFIAIAALINATKPADVVTTFEAMERAGTAEEGGGLAYLNALAQSVPSASNVRAYGEIVRKHALARAYIAAAGDVLTFGWGDASIETKLDKAMTAFGHLDRLRVRKAPRSIGEIAIARTDYYEALERGEIEAGWPTGIPLLDKLLNRLRVGGLYILGARPKVGKTSFALWIARHVAEAGLPVLILSQEMPDTEIADRAVVQAGRVDYSALLSGKLDHDGWARASEGLERLARLPLYVDDQPALTIGDIRSKARQVKGLKVLIVDYVQLCAGTDEDSNRNTQIEAITRGLKALAKTDGIAVIALSQLNRAVELRANKRPQLSDLRDSGGIEQDADAVMFMWPVREFASEGRKIVGLAVEANRQGPTGAFALDFYGAHQRWAESTASLDPPTPTERRGKNKGFEE